MKSALQTERKFFLCCAIVFRLVIFDNVMNFVDCRLYRRLNSAPVILHITAVNLYSTQVILFTGSCPLSNRKWNTI